MGCDLASHHKLITKFNGIDVTKHHYVTRTNGMQTPSRAINNCHFFNLPREVETEIECGHIRVVQTFVHI